MPRIGRWLSRRKPDAPLRPVLVRDSYDASQQLPPHLLLVESCHSTWLFDTGHRQYRRVLKGLDLDPRRASTSWRPYYRLDMDERTDAFVVILNEAGNRLARSWRHHEPCPHCAGEVTEELSVDDLTMLAGA